VSTLFAGVTVADNVRLAAQANSAERWRFWRSVSAQDATGQRAHEAMERLGILHRRGDLVADLSHGEQRQLEIAMALVTQPRVLLLDEPAAGLSSGERARLRAVLEELPRSLPFVLIEHDLALALQLADRVLCMNNGRQLALGTPDDVRSDATVQAVYLGRSVDA
jgi:branched-chain amino acid transport system ATP-binding protein